jgi:hypothetical protein
MSNVDADKIKAIIAEQISIKVEEIVDTSSSFLLI